MVTRVPTRMITTTGVQAGSYTAADITVNEAGQITGAASNSVVVSGGGGGPKITGVTVTDNAWTVLDDTAVDVLGGYIKITGSGFNTGCLVYINQTLATATTYISSTEVRAQLPATAAGTYALYLVNSDGGVGIRLPGVTFSASPSWQTSSSLGELYDGVAISLSLTASEATSYTLVSGSLPPGLTLNTSTGAITGTIVGVTADTTYSFIVRATDAQNQDSPRTFTVNVAISDPHFSKTTLLLSGSALTTNTVLRDSSTNNFNLTAVGDTRASNFSPYGTGWSYYFPANGYLTTSTLGNSLGTSDFCMECWVYSHSYATNYAVHIVVTCSAQTIFLQTSGNQLRFLDFNGGSNFIINGGSVVNGQWHHIVGTRQSGTVRGFIDGKLVATQSSMNFNYGTVTNIQVSGTIESYIAGAKVTIGSVPAAYQTSSTTLNSNIFAVPTGYVSSEANTLLLTAQTNRFINQVNNTSFATISGSPRVASFNPFNITNTGTDGSIYFDGTGDYITTPGNAAFALGTGDFCLETWIYPNSINTGTFDRIMATSDYSGTGFDWTLNTASSALYVAGTAYSISNLVVKSWNHLVYTRSGGVLRGFLNGNLAVYNASATGNVTSTGELRIGYGYSGTSYNGHISNLRIVKGSIPVAYQTSTTTINTSVFSPPTTPLTAVANTQLLTLQYDQPHNNNTFLDASSNQFLLTRYGNATQGSFSPFSQNGWSAYFDGTGDHLQIASNAAFTLGSSADFTVECWIYPTANFAASGVPNYIVTNFSSYSSGYTNRWGLAGISTNVIGWYDSTGTFGTQTASLSLLNKWTHVAVVRSASIIKIYIDGVQNGTPQTANQTYTTDSELNIGYTAAGNYFTGYISNVRIVKGTAIYTSNFTPPTTALTAITNTTLLTCQSNRFVDTSTNNFSITRNGDARIINFSPFSPTATYSPAVHGSSAYFDGSGDYLEMTYNPAFRFAASQDFCVEFWAYATSSLTTNYILSQVATNNWGFIFGVGSVTSGRMGVYYGNGASNVVQYLDDTAAFPLYQWIHVAWCRTSGTMSLFVDGTRRSTVANINAINLTSDRGIRVGAHQDGAASTFWPGYIAGLRSIVGNSPYNATLTTLTLPTAPPISTANTQILLNFADSAIIDSTGRNVIETVADAKSSSVITKFTGASMYFDGTGDYIKIPPSQNIALGTTFTVECWIYLTSWGSGTAQILDVRTSNIVGTMYLVSDGTARFQTTGTGTLASQSGITLNSWIHVAFVSDATSSRVYVNGSNTGGTNQGQAQWPTTPPGYAWIGSSFGPDSYFSGYMQDLRITKSYARYTSNFTPPTAPHRLK